MQESGMKKKRESRIGVKKNEKTGCKINKVKEKEAKKKQKKWDRIGLESEEARKLVRKWS